MDAICFVVGLSAKDLRRADKLQQLVSGAGGELGAAPAPKTASVTLVYVVDADEIDGYEAGEEVTFQRTITAAGSSIYRVNGAEVSAKDYTDALDSINVRTRARNFLVFQGDITTVAQKGPRDMLRHFELFSGSLELKEEYEVAAKTVADLRLEVGMKAAKKRSTAGERKAIKTEAEEAERYLARKGEREGLRVQHALLGLWGVESSMGEAEAAAAAATASLSACSEKEAEATASLAEAVKVVSQAHKRTAAAERGVATAEKTSRTAAAEVEEVQSRIDGSTKRLEAATAEAGRTEEQRARHLAKVAELEAEIGELQAKIEAIDKVSGQEQRVVAGVGRGTGCMRPPRP